jgi:DNA-directed RNA polymerase specialized sigma24 family protein
MTMVCPQDKSVEKTAYMLAKIVEKDPSRWDEYLGEAWEIVEAARRSYKADKGARLSTFTIMKARNRAIDMIRRREVRARKIPTICIDDRVPARPSAPTHDQEAAEFLAKNASETLLLQARGCAIGQIAKVFDVPVGTAKSAMHRDRARARKAWENRA